MKKARFLLVACSGPDGSGKTTLARNTVENLRRAGHDSHYHWMRLGTSRFLELAKKLAPVGDGSRGGSSKDLLERRSLLRRAWAWVLAADYLVRVWTKVLLARAVGGVHVVDRYAVDAAVDLQVLYGSKHGHGLTRLAPKPQLRVMVTAPGLDLLRRGDTPATPRVLEASMAAYEGWSRYFTHFVDASGGPDETARELTDLVLAARRG